MRCMVPGCSNASASARFHASPWRNGAPWRTWLRSPALVRTDSDPSAARALRVPLCNAHLDALGGAAVPTVLPWIGIRAGMLSRSSQSSQSSQSLKEETSDKEGSPTATGSQTKEDPTQKAVKISQTAEVSNILKSSEVMVDTQCLPELFKFCSICLVECCFSIEGHERLFSVKQDCQSCGHHREWKSHPDSADEPAVAFRDEHKDHKQHENHEKPSHEHKNEDAASNPEVTIKAESGDEHRKEISDKEDSPAAVGSQRTEDPAQEAVKISQTAEVSNILKSSEMLVNTQCLLELFKCCSACLVECCITIEGNERLFSVKQDCQSCGHHREWKSHPDSADEPAVAFRDEHKDKKDKNHEKPSHEEHKVEDTPSNPEVTIKAESGDEHRKRVVTVPHRLKTKEVSMEIKQTIVSLRNQKKSIREIGKTLGLSKSTVGYILQKKASTGDVTNRKRPGRPKKTTEEDDQIILSIMTKNPQTPVQQIRNTLKEVGREVSVTTIRRKLHLLKRSIETAFLHNLQVAN